MRIAIIDHDNENAGRLQAVLNNLGYSDVRIEEVLDKVAYLYQQWPVDLVFMRIGLWTPEMISLHRSLKKKPIMAFTAGDHQRGYGGLGLVVPFYLPVRFKHADVEKLLLSIKSDPGLSDGIWNSMLIRDDGMFHSIVLEQITRIVAKGAYITIHTQQGQSYIIFLSLVRLMQMLPADLFCRINRSTILPLRDVPIEHKRCWMNRGVMVCLNEAGGTELFKKQKRKWAEQI